MKTLALFLFLIFPNLLLASDLSCHLADKPGQSELLIEYDENKPVSMYLRSPGESRYRKQNVSVSLIKARKSGPSGDESFVARPVPPQDIPWEEIEECYAHIGTLWYFQFDHDRSLYQVQFVPEYAKEYDTCVPPRFPPQTNALDCTTR